MEYSDAHPPYWRSARQELVIVQPLQLSMMFALGQVAKLPVGFPGRELWLSLSSREQAAWTPVVMAVWYALIGFLTAHPTTSYFYPGSPGFHWIQSSPADPNSIATPSLPTGRWRWSFDGAPSSPGHPLAEKRSLLPIYWLIDVFFAPMVLCWLMYVTGRLGDTDGPRYKSWFTWTSVASFALFPICFWMAGDKVEDAAGLAGKV